MDGKNKLYFGDNLRILREYVPDASVDLIYLDPPFNSSATYNVASFVAPTFRSASAGLKPGATPDGEESAAQITAFEAVAPIYDRRLWPEEYPAVIDRRYSRRNRRRFTGKSSSAARASSPT